MKNKNLFTKIMLCVCLCLPSTVTLSACKNDEHNISDKWSNNASYHWHKCLDDGCDYALEKAEHIYDDDNDMTCNTCGYIRQEIQLYKNVTISGVISDYTYVKQGENAHFELKLSDNYDPNTLKIMNGTTELTWTKADNLTTPTTFTDEDVAVGTLDIENVQGHLDLVATAEEATIDYVFETSKTTYTEEEQTILSEFTLKDGKTLYEALTTEGYRYKLSVSEFKNKKINFTSTYDSEVYDLEGNTKIQKNATNKSFSFVLGNSEIDNNKIYFGDTISYATVNVEKVSGTILSAEVYYSEENIEQDNDTMSYNFSKDGEIRVTINENANFDLANLKVWLNKTEMSFHAKDTSIENDKVYYYLTISKEKSPTFYAGEKAEKYEISVTGVTLKDDATGVSTIRLDNETEKEVTANGNRLSWDSNNCYYYDNNSEKIYLINNNENNNEITLIGTITKFSITANDTTYTIDFTELFKTENGIIGNYNGNNPIQVAEKLREKYTDLSNILVLTSGQYFTVNGEDANGDGKISVSEIGKIEFEFISNLPNNITITILG